MYGEQSAPVAASRAIDTVVVTPSARRQPSAFSHQPEKTLNQLGFADRDFKLKAES
jgi:hypothetical protein